MEISRIYKQTFHPLLIFQGLIEILELHQIEPAIEIRVKKVPLLLKTDHHAILERFVVAEEIKLVKVSFSLVDRGVLAHVLILLICNRPDFSLKDDRLDVFDLFLLVLILLVVRVFRARAFFLVVGWIVGQCYLDFCQFFPSFLVLVNIDEVVFFSETLTAGHVFEFELHKNAVKLES